MNNKIIIPNGSSALIEISTVGTSYIVNNWTWKILSVEDKRLFISRKKGQGGLRWWADYRMLYYATTIPMVHDFRLMLSFVFSCPMFKEEYVGEVVWGCLYLVIFVLAASGSNYESLNCKCYELGRSIELDMTKFERMEYTLSSHYVVN